MVEFVIVFPGRCGSNMLTRMLRQHPQIDITAYEAFAEEPLARGDRRPIEDDEDGAEFARRVIYGRKRPGIEAIGFKLAYHHARRHPHATVWNELRRRPVRVIHLTRINALDRLISLELASSQGKWVADQGERGIYEARPVTISFEYLAENAMWLARSAAAVRELVPADRRLEITYEALAAEPDVVLQRTLAFIGVSPLAIAPLTRRQRIFGQRQALANYDELRDAVRLHRPEWEHFFTDV